MVCTAAIASVEGSLALPPGVLQAIGLVESGRIDPARREALPWPWTINVGGQGSFFDTRAQAVEAVTRLQAAGIRSIDVGCLQVNLEQHPGAFRSIDEAFDPAANALYAGRFLRDLFCRSTDWVQAAGAYHSLTPVVAAPYVGRIRAIWPGLRQDLAEEPGLSAVELADPAHVATQGFLERLVADAIARRRRTMDNEGPALIARLGPGKARPEPNQRRDVGVRPAGLSCRSRPARPTPQGSRHL